MNKAILITGSAGYIGSHVCVSLLQQGHAVVGIDNFSRSSSEAIKRIRQLAGPMDFVEGDIRSDADLDSVFEQFDIGAVIHLAGYKLVGESSAEPMLYYDNNIAAGINLFKAMDRHGVKNLVFSSSCTVYGAVSSKDMPLKESTPLGSVSPYGHSKLVLENLLTELASADPEWKVLSLRYFNPIGAHPSGLIGDDPGGPPNNLVPYLMMVAVGELDEVQVYGGDYPTPDGTCVRDYIHVCDVADGHLSALDTLESVSGFEAINLGTGVGLSVLDVIKAARKATGVDIPYRIVDRRPGDAAVAYADPSLARERLGWKATIGIDEMCNDHWRWQSGHPKGYSPTLSLVEVA